MDNNIVRFKKLLEYFVCHQNYMASDESTNVPGYDKYIKPRIDSGNFVKTGQGYADGSIQNQINGFDEYFNHQICINIQPNFGNYTSKKSYLNWRETGLNIFCEWNNNEVRGLSIGHGYWWERPTQYKILLKYSLEDLALYNDSDEVSNELIAFYSKFMSEYTDYKNHQGKYFMLENEYYQRTKREEYFMSMKPYISILEHNYNLILTGAPGTGKTYLAKQIAAQMILGSEYDEKNECHEKKMDEQFDFVQFHPSYDYTDFIEGLRPWQDEHGNIGFKREDGVFMAFCRKALKAYNAVENKEDAPKYVFVIDEINRGELSKIFGELFFSIDPGYRGSKGKVKTQYANLWKSELDKFDDGNKFYIPKNVYIIGTMNDIDRSVESMDFAMRRRFAFEEIKAETRYSMIEENAELSVHAPKIKKRMENLNNCILTIQGLSTAYQIGASYFLKLKNYLDNGRLTDSSWKSLWDNHLKGLLFEYLRGLPNADSDLKKLEEAYNLKPKEANEEIISDDNTNE